MARGTTPLFDPGTASFLRIFEGIEAAATVVEAGSGRVFMWNAAAEALFGWTADDMLGRSVEVLVPEHLRTRHREGMARYARAGRGAIVGSHLPMVLPAIHRDGRRLTIEMTFTAVDDLEIDGAFVLGVIRDVTARQEADTVIARQRAALDASAAQLRNAERYKDEFLSVLSHELRTPLSPVLGYASMLLDGLAGDLTAAQHEYVTRIQGGAERLQRLIADLLQLVTIRAGRFEVDPSATPVGPLVAEALAIVQATADQKGLDLTAELDEALEAIAEGPRIVEVLVRLLTNAVTFTPPGGRVTVRVRRVRDHAVFEVADSGPGIAEADQAGLFRSFRQLDMSTTRSAGGLGVGLTLCKAIVEAHEGTIGVRSQPGHGSTFWFTLPAL